MIECTPIGFVRNAATRMSEGNWTSIPSEIQPYMPMFDRIDDARMPQWVTQFMAGYF